MFEKCCNCTNLDNCTVTQSIECRQGKQGDYLIHNEQYTFENNLKKVVDKK